MVSFLLTADLSGGKRHLTSQQLGTDNYSSTFFFKFRKRKQTDDNLLCISLKAFNLVKTMKPQRIRTENLLGLGILSLHLKSVASMR